jgi:hypothetical protein
MAHSKPCQDYTVLFTENGSEIAPETSTKIINQNISISRFSLTILCGQAMRKLESSICYLFRLLAHFCFNVLPDLSNRQKERKIIYLEFIFGPTVCALRRAIAEVKQRWSVIVWVTKNLLSRAPPCFGRHVNLLVPVAFALVGTHQLALGPRGGL